MINKLIRLSYIVVFLMAISCNNQKRIPNIKTGDLLFRSNTASALSGAISKVTQTHKSTNYSHVGICLVTNDTTWVYDAAPKKGVCKELLQDFINPEEKDNNTYSTDVYRLKKEFRKAALEAIKKAPRYIGQPYDYTYILKNKGYYCSEFIYELFKDANIFKLSPMTFKNHNSDTFNNVWVNYYKKLGIKIPEGELGCNPNGMANNKQLKFITNISIQH